MGNSSNRWTDQRLETIIGGLLRGGVLLAASVVTLGAVIFLARYGHEIPRYGTFVSEPEDLRSVSGILRHGVSFHGRQIIQLGLLILIATPVARVAFSIIAFALQRDRLYVGITLLVLAVLVFSLAGAQPLATQH
jgi:uncharacterized membrane protein